MKTTSNQKAKIKDLIIKFIIGFLLISADQIHGQNFEVDISYGSLVSKSTFHHNTPVNNEEKGFRNLGGKFVIGLSTKPRNNWRFRTELGYIATNTFLTVNYQFDEGRGLENEYILSWLNNQKIYMGFLPERIIDKPNYTFFVTGGLLIALDISNALTTRNHAFLTDSRPIGAHLGSGITFR